MVATKLWNSLQRGGRYTDKLYVDRINGRYEGRVNTEDGSVIVITRRERADLPDIYRYARKHNYLVVPTYNLKWRLT